MMIKITGTIAAAMLAALLLTAAAMWQGLIDTPTPLLRLLAGAKEPEHSARYYPPDTMMYGWATLLPQKEQRHNLEDTWQRLNGHPDFADLIERLKIELLEETGIDLDADVKPWVGPGVSAGLLRVGPENQRAVAVVMIGVRNHDAADAFLAKWREYATSTRQAHFSKATHGSFDTWSDEQTGESYALSKQWLLYGSDRDALTDTLDRITGDGRESLADQEDFRAARAALPGDRSSSVFLAYGESLDALQGLAGAEIPTGVPGIFGSGLTKSDPQEPDWIAGSLSWIERGVTMEVAIPARTLATLRVAEARPPGPLLPADTVALVAGAFDPSPERWREATRHRRLAEMLGDEAAIEGLNEGIRAAYGPGAPTLGPDATMADAIDLALWLAQDATGINLETELLAHLDGQAILAAREFDLQEIQQDPAGHAVDTVLMLSYHPDAEGQLADTMTRLGALLEEQAGMAGTDADVGADREARVFDPLLLAMMTGGEIAYRPGYVLHDRQLTIGTTERALEAIVETQNSRRTSLAENPRYLRAIGPLDPHGSLIGYIDAGRILRQIQASGAWEGSAELTIAADTMGALAFGAGQHEGISHSRLVLTLFREDDAGNHHDER